ncbi:leucine-rich repeat and IQ domain-containing protein 3-like [Leucoraja erinacea]|uniref:leucine-rich repeat and IQ domain-containing protein 3-like n=1 Tax=Leucoraja erinaceus TaxID=7782 RepID=UPI0024565FB4|nr:leucine-rich repeat and IQ domain-containing protein 3-like [Leucoraja erinacea]
MARRGVCVKPERSQISSELKRLVDNTHLVSPSISLILSCGEMVHMSKEKKLNEIVVVNMSACYLINMGYLTNCSALRVCILPRNYISKMDALSNCPNLIKLDLHSNHITEIPDEFFWREMKCLQVLYLHNNIIGDTCSVEALSSCPQLTVLTLYDTPISLVPKYRHFVVNSIWSLKALDNFVIADEELMEDELDNSQYRAHSHQFLIYPPIPPQISTWRSELDNVQKLVGIVNNILAHHSPVHIIQRWVRGHLTRKKLGQCRLKPRLSTEPHVSDADVLCHRGIHMLEDGRVWVEEASTNSDGECNALQLQIDLNKLQTAVLEDRYEASELTSGIYPQVSKWNRWESPNLRPQRDDIFRPRDFRRPIFHPSPG